VRAWRVGALARAYRGDRPAEGDRGHRPGHADGDGRAAAAGLGDPGGSEPAGDAAERAKCEERGDERGREPEPPQGVEQENGLHQAVDERDDADGPQVPPDCEVVREPDHGHGGWRVAAAIRRVLARARADT
jgi:hypothetical protein